MPLINERANSLLDSILGTPGFLPSNIYIGLLTAAPNSDGTGVEEPIGNAYARVLVANSLVAWPAASNRIKTHAADIVFPQATANWGIITYVGIFSSASGANLKLYNALDVGRTVNAGDQFRFLTGTSPLRLTA